MTVFLGTISEMTKGFAGFSFLDSQEKINQSANARYLTFF